MAEAQSGGTGLALFSGRPETDRQGGSLQRLQHDSRERGMTLTEVMVVVAIIGALAGVGAFATREWWANQAVRSATRNVADLLIQARSESIRTGVPHIVYFDLDPADDPLLLDDGTEVPALLISDDDGDGMPDNGEVVGYIQYAPENAGIFWGRSVSSTLVPNTVSGRVVMGDPFDATPLEGTTEEGDSAGNFRHPTNNARVNSWVMFAPNGTPRSFIPAGATTTTGTMGSGDGAVYLSNGNRDYAIVVAPLGGVRTFAWEASAGAWR